MGLPKESLVLNGESMLNRQLRLLRSVSRSVSVIGRYESDPDSHTFETLSRDVEVLNRSGEVRFTRDLMPDAGPLGGIYSALRATRTEFNLVLACDLPFVIAGLLRYLIESAVATKADITVPKSREGEYQPVCAVYRRRALGAIRASLLCGQKKVTRFFPDVQCNVILWNELARKGLSPRVFDNMNTPEEYEAAKRSVNVEFSAKVPRA
jgi:molybdopterin-guanine dinucleotide biosynthesis protein A